MRKLTIAIILVLLSLSARPQAVLEHTYQDKTIWNIYHLDSYGWVYAVVNYSYPINQLWIYSKDHQLIKTIPIQIPSGFMLLYISSVSDKLFNTDSKIEVLFSCTHNSQDVLILQNENGEVLQQFPDAYIGYVYQFDGEFKMRYSNVVDSNSYVYSLPGTMVDVPELTDVDQQQDPFPNPCSNFIDIASGKGEQILVYNAQGKEVLNISAGPFGFTRINTFSLPSGNYLYRISPGGSSPGKFSVLH